MSAATSIEWTEATWNPVRGCSVVSPGCTNCYAMRQAHRHANAGGAYAGLTKLSKGGPVWTGEMRTVPELLDWPLRKRKPLYIFVNSMSDLFHEDVPDEFIRAVFSVMAQAKQHTFQVLTKRAARMRDLLEGWRKAGLTLREGCGVTLPNVWLGVSVEDQRRADERIPLLLETPAAVRWISAEPLLEAINVERYFWHGVHVGEARHRTTPSPLHWVVCGGESGPGARTFDIAWARLLRDQCRAAGVPYFLKQLGCRPISHQDEGYPWAPLFEDDGHGDPTGEWGLDGTSPKGGDPTEWPEDLRVREYPS